MDDIETIARGLTKAQRMCGDILDRFPCTLCGAERPRDCQSGLSDADISAAVSAINRTEGLGTHLRAIAWRAYLEDHTNG